MDSRRRSRSSFPMGRRKTAGSLDATSGDDGYFEVMDEGSQCIANAVGAREGERILDACAGNGGKTLAMAANMGGARRNMRVRHRQTTFIALEGERGARARRRAGDDDGIARRVSLGIVRCDSRRRPVLVRRRFTTNTIATSLVRRSARAGKGPGGNSRRRRSSAQARRAIGVRDVFGVVESKIKTSPRRLRESTTILRLGRSRTRCSRRPRSSCDRTNVCFYHTCTGRMDSTSRVLFGEPLIKTSSLDSR